MLILFYRELVLYVLTGWSKRSPFVLGVDLFRHILLRALQLLTDKLIVLGRVGVRHLVQHLPDIFRLRLETIKV
jgi:hypothetical protein